MGGGGFVAGPAGLAAVLTGTPLVLTEADSHLGLANRLLAGRAKRVCLAFPIAGREGDAIPGDGTAGARARCCGADRAKARERFGVAPDDRCLLVMGGSQGARSINLCAVEAFAERPGRDFHVVHLAAPARLRRAGASVSARRRTATATPCSPTSPTSATPSPPATWCSAAPAARSSR